MLTQIVPPDGGPARYTDRPLPPYRYVPGLHPHPVAHPQGHSYNPSGAHPAAGPLLEPRRWREMADYLYGTDLYNLGYFWEAHEAWEGLWQQSDKGGTQGRFLQGLIQVSAAQLKRHVGEAEGVSRLLERARRHVDAVIAAEAVSAGGQYMGLHLPRFVEQVQAFFSGQSPVFPFVVLATER